MARAVVVAAYEARRLAALDQLRYRMDQHSEQIHEHLAAGDEVGIVTFLRADVETLLERLGSFDPAVASRVAAYRDALDPRAGTVYRGRQIFEESVTRLTEASSAYLEPAVR